jgi:uncharacterized protein
VPASDVALASPSLRAKALAEFATWAKAHFGVRLRELLLFGSESRGEARPDSDIDVAVVVDDMSYDEGRECAYFAGDILTKYDVLVAPFALSTERMNFLRARERMIAKEIERDGVPL